MVFPRDEAVAVSRLVTATIDVSCVLEGVVEGSMVVSTVVEVRSFPVLVQVGVLEASA